jgi:DNA topoisomerase I
VARRGGWRRLGRKRFRYVDARGGAVTADAALERIQSLAIPPAWRDVWISPNARAKLQATGVDSAGRRQYLYHPAFRAAREQQKYERLVRFGEHLPALRADLEDHLDRDPLEREWTCGLAVTLRQPRLVSRGLGAVVGAEPYLRDHHPHEASRERAR